jgi:hypothetical protein
MDTRHLQFSFLIVCTIAGILNSVSVGSAPAFFVTHVYVDFKLGKGLIVHIEGESMYNFIPSTLLGTPDIGSPRMGVELHDGDQKGIQDLRKPERHGADTVQPFQPILQSAVCGQVEFEGWI